MKIALLQCDVTTGSIAANAEKIIIACRNAQNAGAALCAVSSQALAGPDAAFFTRMPFFAEDCRKTAMRMAAELENGPALLCGHPHTTGRALLLSGGCAVDIMDGLNLGGLSISIGHAPKETVFQATAVDADIILDLEAWPFQPGRRQRREERMARAAAVYKVWIMSANLAGGYDGLIFSGKSAAFDPQGRLWGRGAKFAEDMLIVDTDATLPGKIEPPCEDLLDAQWGGLVLGVADFARKAGAGRAILGLSGGMDSALVACVAAEALGPENVTGILMPSPWSSESSVADAKALAGNLGIATMVLPIEGAFKTLEQTIGPALETFPAMPGDLTFENLQARIRGVLLMAAANRGGAIVLNTGNKSELAMGYCTLYGDTCGALAVLGDLYKTRVYELAKWLCEKRGRQIIPQNIFDKAPSAELRPGQKDTDSLPPYEELDPLLAELLAGGKAADTPELREIAGRMINSRFKARQCPPPILVGGAPFKPECRRQPVQI